MKTAKRFLTAALAVLFTLMCALPALAADETETTPETFTLTIDNPEAGHTYEAYQIFSGSYSEDENKKENYLSDINWGSGIIHEGDADYSKMIKELDDAGLYDNGETDVSGVNDATKVAMALSKQGKNSPAETADKFNEIVGRYLTTPASTVVVPADNTDAVEFPDKLTAGYYLVKDKNDTVPGNQSYTKYLVKLVANTTIDIKTQSMSLTKKIVEKDAEGKDTLVEANNAAMGEKVQYQLNSHTSAMDGYENYTFVIYDTLDGGLTFDETSLKATVGTQDYTDRVTITYATAADGNYSAEKPAVGKDEKLYIKLTFADFTKQTPVEDYTDKDVVVTYSATVNENAVIGTKPNINAAYLVYSNNPNESQNDNAGNTSTTQTPEQKVYTFVAGIQIDKVSPETKHLPGAQFSITGNGLQMANVIGYSFEKDTAGKYYLTEDNSYVTVKPADATEAYKANLGTYAVKGDPIVGMTSDQAGKVGTLGFEGLKQGTYTVKEVLAPSGYQILDDPITIEIEWSYNNNGTCTWTYKIDGEPTAADDRGVGIFTIVNDHGLTLPFTGGAGANLLAGLGLALMVAAGAAFLYIKRRQNRE